MKKTNILIGAICLIFSAMLFDFVTNKSQAQDKVRLQQDEEATVIVPGQITNEDRAFGQQFRKLYPDFDRTFSYLIDFSERIGKGTTEIGGSYGESLDVHNNIKTKPIDFLVNLKCASDTIVIGSVKDKRARISEDETLIFTKYDFLVRRVFKNNSNSSINDGTPIEIARPGGLIIFKNRRIRQENVAYEVLEKNKTYLLFLKYLPGAKGYIPASREGSFLVENNSIKSFAIVPPPKEIESNPSLEQFAQTLNLALPIPCQKY